MILRNISMLCRLTILWWPSSTWGMINRFVLVYLTFVKILCVIMRKSSLHMDPLLHLNSYYKPSLCLLPILISYATLLLRVISNSYLNLTNPKIYAIVGQSLCLIYLTRLLQRFSTLKASIYSCRLLFLNKLVSLNPNIF